MLKKKHGRKYFRIGEATKTKKQAMKDISETEKHNYVYQEPAILAMLNYTNKIGVAKWET